MSYPQLFVYKIIKSVTGKNKIKRENKVFLVINTPDASIGGVVLIR